MVLYIPHNVYVNELSWGAMDSTGALFDSIRIPLLHKYRLYAKNGNLYVMDRIVRMVWASRNAHNETIGCAMPSRGRYYTKICVGQGGILG